MGVEGKRRRDHSLPGIAGRGHSQDKGVVAGRSHDREVAGRSQDREVAGRSRDRVADHRPCMAAADRVPVDIPVRAGIGNIAGTDHSLDREAVV